MTLWCKQALIGCAALLVALTASACDFSYVRHAQDGQTNDGSSAASISTTLAATPELDSIVLLGAGLLSSAGYLYRRMRHPEV